MAELLAPPSSLHPPRLLAIVGPTASGKSKLAMRIACEFNGEIICADSRTVYKGMDIGTAKPSKADQNKIPHHLLDMAEPNQAFTAADFQRQAKRAIREIIARKHLPILVGGSGLYVDCLLFNFRFPPRTNHELHTQLNSMDIEKLRKYADDNDIFLGGIEHTNKRHIVRAIERGGVIGQKRQLPKSTIIVGINPSRENLRRLVEKRASQMIKQGFIKEAQRLARKYGWEYEANTIYSPVRQYREGTTTKAEIREELIKKHLNLAKRQRTWFKRNKFIQWFESSEQAYDFLRFNLAKR